MERMPTAAERAEEERYARQQLFSDTSDDEVEPVPWKSEGINDQKVPAVVDLTIGQGVDAAGLEENEDSDRKMAAVVDRTIDQESEEAAVATPEENVPDVEMVQALSMVDEDVEPDERIMDPGDRHRAIVSYRLDELTQIAAWNESDEITIGSGSNKPINIMAEVDPAFVRRMDLAIVLNDEAALDVLFGVAPDKNNESDVSFMVRDKVRNTMHNLPENDIVFDTEATKHSMKCMNGAIKTRSASGQEVVAFDGRATTINCCFDLRGDVLDKDDNVVSTLTLTNVSYVLDSKFNLFSASQAIKQGLIGHIDDKSARLTKGNEVLTFDRLIPTGTSMLYALRLVPRGTQERCNLLTEDPKRNEDSETSNVKNSTSRISTPVRKVTSERKISKFSHMGPRSANVSAKHFGSYDVIPGGVIMCEHCMIAKSKRAVIPKTGNHVLSNTPNCRIYTDITTIREVGWVKLNKGVWLEIKDEYTKYSTSLFMSNKSDMSLPLCQLLSHWKAINKKVNIVRWDNEGENRKFEEKATSVNTN